MKFEIPAGTTRLLEESKAEALKFGFSQVTTICLLFTALKNERIVEIFKAINVDIDAMLAVVRKMMTENSEKSNELLDLVETNGDFAHVDFDTNCTRIVRLLALEYKLYKGRCENEELIILSILHDRQNDAKTFLMSYGITYEKAQEAFIQKESITPQDDFSFPNEDNSPFPDDMEGGSQQAANNRTNTAQKKSDSDTPITDNFGTDLTKVAENGGLDPVVGREKEIERIVQILCRRKKNNPIIIGEPGVGKSAIVEGLAERIAEHNVPHLLDGKRIVSLNMATIVAGTQYRGQFEERLRRLIKELQTHPEIILFIDEIHTIIGAGSAPGSLDAANILKPALARGEIQCIGATTINEFKKTIEKDGALDRRFQKIMLEPTTAEETLTILHNIKKRYEDHHNVSYTDEALKACVDLTIRYVTDRALPDKAIDALDEVGARMHLAVNSKPKELEELQQHIDNLREQKMQAAKEQNYELAANLRDQVQELTRKMDVATDEWQNQQKNHPSEVDAEAVAEVVSMMSGVPATRIATDEGKRLKGMRGALSQKVIAQDKAIERLTRAITRSRIGLKGNDRPIGTFLFVGPTGVGKTHLVKCLAEWMFGSKDALIRVDMSEYGEKYSVSRLVGAPPGYVGYEEGGQLTERVRRHPYSVILLDEIEKAHPDVFNTLLQVMDEGRMTDGNGTTVDFRNTIIILTSNSGTRQLREFGSGIGFGRTQGEMSSDTAESIILKTLRKQFAPEFLNRLDDIIMFNPLNKESALQIAQIELNDLMNRMTQNGFHLSIDEQTKNVIVDKGFDAQYGARSLKRSIQHNLEDPLCDFIMEHPGQTDFHTEVKEGKVVIE